MTTTARPTAPASPGTGADTHAALHSTLHALRLVALLALVAGLILPTLARPAQAQAGAQATITVTSLGPDGATPLPFARFLVTDSLGTTYPERETAPPDGTTTFTLDLIDDTVTYTVSEETPPACGVAPAPRTVGPLADGDAEELTFTTTFTEGCDLGSISVYSYTCPDGLDLSITDYAQYRDSCVTTNDGVAFTIAAKKGGQSFDLTTGEFGIPGRAPLVGLKPGTYLLTPGPSDSNLASLVYCSTYKGVPGGDSGPTAVDQKQPNAKGAVELKLKGDRIACDVFRVVGNLPANVAGNDDAGNDSSDGSGSDAQAQDNHASSSDNANGGSSDGTVAAGDRQDAGTAASDPGSIEFHIATCPLGFDGPDYFATCSDAGLAGVTFSVTGQDTSTTQDSDPTVQPVAPGFGITTIADLSADTYTMGASVPGDFIRGYFVYCADSPGGGPRIQTPQHGEVQPGFDTSLAFDIALAPGQDVICDWYVLPDNLSGLPLPILRLTAFTCASGYGGTTFGDVTTDCADPTQGIAFNLASDAGGYDVDKTTNGDGKARFTALSPAADYVLDEDLPGDALDDRIAYCATDGDPYVEYDASTGTIQLDPIQMGQQIQCLWYVIPTDQNSATATPTSTAIPTPKPTQAPAAPGTLRIRKAECPPGQRDNYYRDCYDNIVGGIGFNVDGPSGYDETGTTSDQGVVTFADMPPGDYVVTELQPADYRVDLYVVACSRDGNPFDFTYDDSSGLRAKLKLPAGADIVCDWYNVPPGPVATPTPTPGAPSATGGSITVITSLCELRASQLVSLADDCVEYGDGADFTLTAVDGGAQQTGTTGTDSRVVFSGLRAGAYALEETSLDWCKAQADAVDPSGNVQVKAGKNTNVYIYNCLPDGKPAPGQPGGSKTGVKTLPSTGTGGPAATARGGVTLATWGAAALAATAILALAAATPALARRRRDG